MTSSVQQTQIKPHGTLYNAPEGQDARLLAGIARDLMPQDRVLVHVATDDARLVVLSELLEFFAPEVEIVEFPAWDCLPYDRVSPNGQIVAKRVASLVRLLGWEKEKRRAPRIVLTTVNAAMQRVMPKDSLQAASFFGRVGGNIDRAVLAAFFERNGYIRTETVREAGEYAMRGGILDFFPPGDGQPVRVDLFGDTVESIRRFDPSTQRSTAAEESFTLQPATEFFLDEDSISRFRAGYRAAFGVVRDDDPLYQAVSEGRRYNGMDHWLPLFHGTMQTVFDYTPAARVTCDHHAVEAEEARLAQIGDFHQARLTLKASRTQKKSGDVSLSGGLYNPLPPSALYLEEPEWQAVLGNAESLSPFAAPGVEERGARKGRDFADIRALPDGNVFEALRAHVQTLSQKILIACYSDGARERIRGILENAGLGPFALCDKAADLKYLKPGTIGLCVLSLEHGFEAPDLAVMTEQDLFGDRLTRRSRKRKRDENFLREVSSLAEGDLVVHVDHGIGRFVALETLKAANTLHDCLKIEYAGGDRLYVPVENIEVLSRYGNDEGTIQLDRLGGAGWQARKAKAKKDLMAMAEGLLKIAAARQLQKADRLESDPSHYNAFAARFPYQETEDQDRAITDTLYDLSRDFPMDRLVCGDVGFGKTEVALRAAYVAAMGGAQVAVAVPTTLLARQHHKNFIARFAGTGLRVAQLSRMVGAKEADDVRKGLADGSVQIVIGTHALFGKSVRFKHLGLLIVDEEQRFGVKQKERLKELKQNIHVLTLSATPIPRTLQMSLTGVKELSLIATPPVDRLAVRSFVLPYDPLVVREALMREHYRGGQSFYVCPRIKDMTEIEKELKELVPELKLVSAHGQMPPADLDDRMTAFYDGQYDVLLATNIIESGIDIPTANTMIIHRADMFGLAQLYQIRGRIGRSKQRAYAYLTYAPGAKLNPQAIKRLEVMERLDTLGAGFQLASYDMDIRGAGNLLGEQQSGHIREIGVELYQQMLEDAVAEARAGGQGEAAAERGWSPVINLGTSVLIPELYVEDLGVRMSLYRRLSDLETAEDIDSFAAEMIDRFGPVPPEFENLLDIVRIKQMCKRAGIASVEAGPKGAVIGFHNSKPPNVEKLIVWIGAKSGTVKLRPDQKLAVMRVWDNADKRVKGAQSLVAELEKIVSP